METLFRWIHLSDIHFGHGDAAHGWDQKLVIESLRRDIGAMREKDPTPVDAILVTGDIAFSGNGRRPTEYADADATLLALGKEAGVAMSEVFLVPGNHDVNRGSDRERNVQRMLEGLRSGQDRIDTALADPGDRAMLARRMGAYLDFARSFAPACFAASPKTPEESLFWTQRLTARSGLGIRMVGLNTSLLCADDQDKGKLYLGNEQIAKALLDPPVAAGELVMVLSHHPLRDGWLGDEKAVDAWVRNNAHIHLSGHVHEADTEQSRSGAGGSFVRITAGATHGDREPAGVPPSHGYSFGAVGREGGKAVVRIWPRKWSPRNASFRTDHDNVPDGQDHAEHDVPKLVLPAKGGGATTAGGPVEVFFSFVPEDDALRQKLEKHLILLRRKGSIKSFSSRAIDPGQSWKGAVDEHLHTAEVILLLISNDYLTSDYCYDTEMEIARRRYESGDAKVIPILLRPSDFASSDAKDNDAAKETTWFEKLQPLPRVKIINDKKITAITQWADVDEAMTEIAKTLRLLVEGMRGARS